jgi:sodium-dependent dicarboxylate transporter 2/3/5
MLWPVALAVVVELAANDGDGQIERSFGTVLMLAIAYSASVGGMSTLIGTGTNVAFAALMRELFPASPEIGCPDGPGGLLHHRRICQSAASVVREWL